MNKTFFHIDVNCAFLSWEAVERLGKGETLDLRTIPSAVCGDASKRHGIILAKSIPAGRYGVKTAETINDALRKCPDLRLIPSTPGLYSRCSRAFMSIIREYTPTIEQLSVDETYADMTGCYDEELGAVAFATMIKDRIKKELGFTVNIGISDKLILSKMASDFEKPDKVHTLFKSEIQAKMWPLPVGDLMYVGKSTAARLKTLGIKTIGELAQFDYELLKLHFGKMADTMHSFANGEDDREVDTRHLDAKNCGHSTTMDHDVTDADEAKNILLSLSEKVGERLRKDNFFAGNVTVTIKNNLLKSCSHQETFENSTNATADIYQHACKLFDELWDGETAIRLLGVSTSDLSHEKTYQYSLFDYDMCVTGPSPKPVADSEDGMASSKESIISATSHKDTIRKLEGRDPEKAQKADAAMDELRKKFGDGIVTRASLLKKKDK